MSRKPRRAPRDIPDSLPKREEERAVLPDSDVLPDDVRRTDQPQPVPPDSLPPAEEDLSADGGVAEHPVHDADLEDRDAEDYERAIDEEENLEGVDVALRKQI